jgi:hypothetical protein
MPQLPEFDAGKLEIGASIHLQNLGFDPGFYSGLKNSYLTRVLLTRELLPPVFSSINIAFDYSKYFKYASNRFAFHTIRI